MNRLWNGFIVCAIVATALLSGAQAMAQQPADVILHNGKVLTVDTNFTIVPAIAIRGNSVAAVGQNADILAMRGSGTQVVDLKGRTVVPGLIDTHRHIYGAAESYGVKLTPHERRRYPLDWRAVRTKADLLNQIK